MTALHTRLDAGELAKAQRIKPYLLTAQQYAGTPWQVICAVAYRESGMSIAPPKRVGGSYQQDPPLTDSQINSLFISHSSLSVLDRKNYILKGTNDFEC